MADGPEITRAIHDAGNITRAAGRLGVSRRTLQNRMRSAGLPRGRAGRPRKRFRRRANVARVLAVSAGVLGAVALVGWARGRSA
jgi:hypothetical protein